MTLTDRLLILLRPPQTCSSWGGLHTSATECYANLAESFVPQNRNGLWRGEHLHVSKYRGLGLQILEYIRDSNSHNPGRNC